MSVNNLNVLLIEDNTGTAENINSLLEGEHGIYSFSLKTADSLAEGLNILRQAETDVVLMSFSLPDNDGFSSFIKLIMQASYLPVIVLGEPANEDLKQKLVQMGAQDYLLKDNLNKNNLVQALLFAIERNKILEPLKRENIRLSGSFKAKEDSERRLKLAFANIQDIIIETDNDIICTFINNAGINFFGNELIGHKMTIFNSDNDKVTDKLQTLFKNEALFFENWNENSKGEKALFSWTCNLISSVKGEKEGFLLTAHDISNTTKSDSPKPEKKHKLLGQLLLEKGYINGQQLEKALAEQHKTKILLGEILIRMGFITPEELADVLIMQAELDSE